MAASILFACGLNEQKLPSYVHISEEENVDSSFLISAILGQRLRITNAGTLLVCLLHNYQHYFNAGMRLGYNANIFLGKTLSLINPITDIGTNGLASRWLADDTRFTTLLLNDIREELDTNFKNRASTTLLIDNLAVLLNLGCTHTEVQQLCNELAKLPEQYENLAVITKLNSSEVHAVLDRNIAKLAELRIRTLKLKSGVFREVDGKMLIERDVKQLEGENTEASGFENVVTTKEILYKVNDRNIKIFSPGEVGLKM